MIQKNKWIVSFLLVFLIAQLSAINYDERIKNLENPLNIENSLDSITSNSDLGLDYSGYIVQLEKEPLVVKMQTLNATAKDNDEAVLNKVPIVKNIYRSFATTSDEIPSEIESYKKDLAKEHENVINQIKKSNSKITGNMIAENSDLKINQEYNLVFNGFSLDVSDEEAKNIAKIKGVKAVYPNQKINILLDESVPLIQDGIPAGRLDADGKDCIKTGKECLTGKGVKVAVIDTGVDYTHLDLGNGYIKENRKFTKITDKSLKLFGDPYGAMASNENYLYYSSNYTIYQYDVKAKQNRVLISLPENFRIDELGASSNFLVYAVFDSQIPSKSSWFIYDLKTNRVVDSFRFVTIVEKAVKGYGDIYWRITSDPSLNEEYFIYPKYDQEYINNESYMFENFHSYNFATKKNEQITWAHNLSYIVGSNVLINHTLFYSVINLDSPDQYLESYDLKTKKISKYLVNGTPVGFVGRDLILKSKSNYYFFNIDTKKITRKFSSYDFLEEYSDYHKEDYSIRFNSYSPSVVFQEGLLYEGNDYSSKIFVYNLSSNRFVVINPITSGSAFQFIKNTLYFLSNDNQIYAHTYNSSYNYLPVEFGFGNKVIGGYDFVDYDLNPFDDNGHGTHVAATIAGKGVLKGVAPDAKILAYKACDIRGNCFSDAILSALEQAVIDDADIVSMSLGGGVGNPNDPLSQATDNVVNAGIVAVVAAGNSGPDNQTIGNPGASRDAITVGAINNSLKLAEFSSRGPVVWTNKSGKQVLIKPDILAPGVDICAAQSLKNPWNDNLCLDNDHVSISGTSMATPHISGVVALIKQAHPDWTPEKIKSILMNNADDLGFSPNKQGAGLVNISRILQDYETFLTVDTLYVEALCFEDGKCINSASQYNTGYSNSGNLSREIAPRNSSRRF